MGVGWAQVYQRQLEKTEMADCMGFGAEERSSGQFTPDELKDLFKYNQDTRCDTHDRMTRAMNDAHARIPAGSWADATDGVEDSVLAMLVRTTVATATAVLS